MKGRGSLRSLSGPRRCSGSVFRPATIGAGPAGVTTALYAKRHGLTVLLVDKHRFPRDKICGDAIRTKSAAYLHDLGLLDEVRSQTHEPIGAMILGAPSGALANFDLNAVISRLQAGVAADDYLASTILPVLVNPAADIL